MRTIVVPSLLRTPPMYTSKASTHCADMLPPPVRPVSQHHRPGRRSTTYIYLHSYINTVHACIPVFLHARTFPLRPFETTHHIIMTEHILVIQNGSPQRPQANRHHHHHHSPTQQHTSRAEWHLSDSRHFHFHFQLPLPSAD